MQKRKFDELISHFNRKVSDMSIDQKYKMELLGMISAIGFAHEKEHGTNLAEVGTDVHDTNVGNKTQLSDKGTTFENDGEIKRWSKDIISRQAAIDALNEYFARIGKLKRRGLTKGEKAISLDTVGAIKTLPPAEPKRGKWVSADAIFGGVPFYCSECGENTWDTVMGKPRWNFCPNCGAKMEVNNESN